MRVRLVNLPILECVHYRLTVAHVDCRMTYVFHKLLGFDEKVRWTATILHHNILQHSIYLGGLKRGQ
jgi:hypothetical protein